MNIDTLIEFAVDAPSRDKNTDDLDLYRGFPSRLQPARQWFNWLFNTYSRKTNEVIDAVNRLDKATDDLKKEIQSQLDSGIGLISVCPFSNIPADTLECDGSTHLIEDYPLLYERLGDFYGGDGSRTFGVPDYRGEFLRGLDHGRGIDVGRSLGSFQADELKEHSHTYRELSQTTAINQGNPGILGNGHTENDTSLVGGGETRPRNIAVIYVIKAK